LYVFHRVLIPFIENAFKHGVNSEQKSRIEIEITMNKTELQLRVVNNKVNVQRDISERTVGYLQFQILILKLQDE
jgi:sensor histidine kinase YesM